MMPWIVFLIGFILGFGSILLLGAYVYFRDFHRSKSLSSEGINKDVIAALSSTHDDDMEITEEEIKQL